LETLFSAVERLTAEAPDAIMFRDPTQVGVVATTRTQFLDQARHFAATFAAHGVGEGDCVASWLPNWSSTVAWQVAASAVGAHVVGINTRYNKTEVAHVLRKARPVVIGVAYEFQRLDLVGRARDALVEGGVDLPPPPAVLPIAAPGTELPESTPTYDLGGGIWRLSDGDGFTATALAFSAERLATAFTTSGSTGLPKLAAHTESGVLKHALANAISCDFRPGDVFIAPLPFSGVFGFNAVWGALFGGASVLMHPVFDEERLLEDMARFGVTHFVGADDMLVRLKGAWEKAPADLGRWRVLLMADFLGRTPEIAAWADSEFGTVSMGVYGSSELFALAAHWRPETPLPRRWSGGGVPASDGIRIRLADPFDGTVLDQGDGELQFRGHNVVDAYLGDEGEGARAFTDDGWFRSGDLGRMTEDGGFEFVCRAGDVLRLRGFLVEPAEVETRLAAHPAVEVAKVVGSIDASGEPVAVGFVTLADGAEVREAELIGWCKDTLARFKVPHRILVIDDMPTTAGTNGSKIKAGVLRDWASTALIS